MSEVDQKFLSWLLADDGSGSSQLANLTGGPYTSADPPDYLSVRTGSNVTPQYAGGYSTVGWVDGDGNEVTFFGTGTPPDASKGVAITYGANASAASRTEVSGMANTYLDDHASDSDTPTGGGWNRPTFDVTV